MRQSTFTRISPTIPYFTEPIAGLKTKKASSLKDLRLFCTRSGNRTRTSFAAHEILSLACLPVPPSRRQLRLAVALKPKSTVAGAFRGERKTGFEPATSTLARSRYTNWDTFAFLIRFIESVRQIYALIFICQVPSQKKINIIHFSLIISLIF